jgi:hypothetical protein
VKDLYCDFAIVFLVVREINGGHAAAAELALNRVRGERTLNLHITVSHDDLKCLSQFGVAVAKRALEPVP